VAALCAVAVAGCDGSAGAASQGSAPPAASETVPQAQFTITPADGTRRVRPDARIRVRVQNAILTAVSVRGDGSALTDLPAARGSAWHTRQTLHTNARYTVRASALDESGNTVTATSSFRTLAPKHTVRVTIFQGYHQTYGVGMPIMLGFDRPVTHKAAVERALELRSSQPVVGAWHWDSDSDLEFRPRNYWPAHTTVHFRGNLDGVQTAPGVYAVHTLTQTFTIGRSLIAVASTASHHVRIYLDHKLFGDWPISSGKPGDDTPNGTYLSINKHNPERMVGPGYDIEVPWSVRFTWSGDYMHDAFWSVGDQGFANVSHGCINLSPANAETYYKMSVPGDPITVTDSPRGGEYGNGWTPWFLGWKNWWQGSALQRAVRVGPKGSTLVKPSRLHRHGKPAPLGAPAEHNSDPA
jgi:lipoprotein-anchoring transpeptidase ErfK/SrfK